jgi:PIN domain nuclease of toxin-antitoxin system
VNVLDASALIAYLDDEPGSKRVEELVDDAVMSAVNWSEAYGKLRARGVDAESVTAAVRATGFAIHPFDAADAVAAGELLPRTVRAGLSLADRACLALAQRLGAPAITADRAWLELDLDVEIVSLR